MPTTTPAPHAHTHNAGICPADEQCRDDASGAMSASQCSVGHLAGATVSGFDPRKCPGCRCVATSGAYSILAAAASLSMPADPTPAASPATRDAVNETALRPPTPERATPVVIHAGFRCGQLAWLGPVAAASGCQQKVLARPAGQCSHRYFVLADRNDNNCACAPPDSVTDCTMGSSELRVAKMSSLYRIAPALSGGTVDKPPSVHEVRVSSGATAAITVVFGEDPPCPEPALVVRLAGPELAYARCGAPAQIVSPATGQRMVAVTCGYDVRSAGTYVVEVLLLKCAAVVTVDEDVALPPCLFDPPRVLHRAEHQVVPRPTELAEHSKVKGRWVSASGAGAYTDFRTRIQDAGCYNSRWDHCTVDSYNRSCRKHVLDDDKGHRTGREPFYRWSNTDPTPEDAFAVSRPLPL